MKLNNLMTIALSGFMMVAGLAAAWQVQAQDAKATVSQHGPA